MDLLILFKAIILGIVEGITEFLPISSTGHLIIVEQFIDLGKNKNFKDAFDVIIQLGAILSVVVVFWSKLWPFSGTTKEMKAKFALWTKVIVGFMPALILGALFGSKLKELFFNPITVSITLTVYGIILIIVENWHKNKKKFRITDVNMLDYKTALLIGVFQCLAMIPGTSRSAATIIGAMLLGLSRSEAAEFSFFLAIPTMFAATVHDVIKLGFSFTGLEWATIGVGFIVSFIVALLVIRVFMGYIKKKDFKPFGYYRIILGIILIMLFLTGYIKNTDSKQSYINNKVGGNTYVSNYTCHNI